MTEHEKAKAEQLPADEVDLHQEADAEKVREFAVAFERSHRGLLDRLAQ